MRYTEAVEMWMKCPMRPASFSIAARVSSSRNAMTSMTTSKSRPSHRALQRLRVGTVADHAADPGPERVRGAAPVDQRDPVAVHEQPLHDRQADEPAAPDDQHLHGAILPWLPAGPARRVRPPCARRRSAAARSSSTSSGSTWDTSTSISSPAAMPTRRARRAAGWRGGERRDRRHSTSGSPAAMPAARPTSGNRCWTAHAASPDRSSGSRRARWRRARAPPSGAPRPWSPCPRRDRPSAASLRAAAIRARVARRSAVVALGLAAPGASAGCRGSGGPTPGASGPASAHASSALAALGPSGASRPLTRARRFHARVGESSRRDRPARASRRRATRSASSGPTGSSGGPCTTQRWRRSPTARNVRCALGETAVASTSSPSSSPTMCQNRASSVAGSSVVWGICDRGLDRRVGVDPVRGLHDEVAAVDLEVDVACVRRPARSGRSVKRTRSSRRSRLDQGGGERRDRRRRDSACAMPAVALEDGGEELALRLRHHQRPQQHLARGELAVQQPGTETLGGPRGRGERDPPAVHVERPRHVRRRTAASARWRG